MSKPTYDQVFESLVKSAYRGELDTTMNQICEASDEVTAKYALYASGGGDPDTVVFKVRDCKGVCGKDRSDCEASCLFNAIVRDMEGNVVVRYNKCTGCGQCVEVCKHYALVDRKEFIPVIRLLKDRRVPVFAAVAPAYIGQFGPNVTPSKLRAAFKSLGFYGMVEVALFADMLTLKEALEFDRHVTTEKDFLLTSCCCPIWVSMVRKVYQDLVPHVSPSVSPMVAAGRGIKRLHPGAKVVFVGPCIAKKAEAKEPDVKDAIDAVLTFQEVSQIFRAVGIDPETLEEDPSEHSSKAGRIYGRTGGVSQAVTEVFERLRPGRTIQLRAVQADGIPECKQLLKDIMAGLTEANFMEGMGCRGGCVGGPKAILNASDGTTNVNEYGDEALYSAPVDNRFVLELLSQLGIQYIEEFLDGEKAQLFTRDFSALQ